MRDSHRRAAELHDLAAHAHRTAAEQHGKQDHLTGHEQGWAAEKLCSSSAQPATFAPRAKADDWNRKTGDSNDIILPAPLRIWNTTSFPSATPIAH